MNMNYNHIYTVYANYCEWIRNPLKCFKSRRMSCKSFSGFARLFSTTHTNCSRCAHTRAKTLIEITLLRYLLFRVEKENLFKSSTFFIFLYFSLRSF